MCGLVAGRLLAVSGHGRLSVIARSASRGGHAATAGAVLSSDDFGSSEERTATLHPRRLFIRYDEVSVAHEAGKSSGAGRIVRRGSCEGLFGRADCPRMWPSWWPMGQVARVAGVGSERFGLDVLRGIVSGGSRPGVFGSERVVRDGRPGSRRPVPGASGPGGALQRGRVRGRSFTRARLGSGWWVFDWLGWPVLRSPGVVWVRSAQRFPRDHDLDGGGDGQRDPARPRARPQARSRPGRVTITVGADRSIATQNPSAAVNGTPRSSSITNAKVPAMTEMRRLPET